MRGKIGSIFIVLFLIFGGFLGFLDYASEDARGMTFVSGTVYDGLGGPWTIGGSPYIVTGNVTVPVGEILTIDSGVQVKFDGFYSLYIDGSLMAIGSETEKIFFTSNKATPASNDWNKIRINSTGHAEIKYADMRYYNNSLYIDTSSNNDVENNTLSMGKGTGIFLYKSTHNKIINNHISKQGAGIYLHMSSNNTISNNSAINNHYGIQLAYTKENQVVNNSLSHNRDGIRISSSWRNIIAENQMHFNWDGIYLIRSSNNSVLNNNISRSNYSAIYLYDSVDNDISSNDVLNNYVGINLTISSNSNLTDNLIISNHIGVTLEGSTNNSIINNTLMSDMHEISLKSSSNTRIYHNNIIDNRFSWISDSYRIVTDDNNGTFWNSTYPVGGNFWSPYIVDCTDNHEGPLTPQTVGSSDGICDIQYNVTENVIDFFPLRDPVKNRLSLFDKDPPHADAGKSGQIEKGEYVIFSGHRSMDNIGIFNYTWNLTKNGKLIVTLYGENVSYMFEEIGTYEVILTVRDFAGNIDEDNATIIVTSDFLSEYWWVFVIIIIAVVLLLVLFLIMRKKKKTEPIPPPEQEAPPLEPPR